MQLDELPGQGESEPGPLDLLVRRPHLPELLEDRLLILRRDDLRCPALQSLIQSWVTFR